MSGKFVMLLIQLEAEKGGQDRTFPVSPDFAEFLRSVPPCERDDNGKVLRRDPGG